MHRPAHIRTRARAVARLLVVALLAFAPSPLRAQLGDQREAPEVRELRLRGVHHVSIRDLERSIATTRSACKSLLLQPFCWVSRSPTFVDRKYLDRDEFRRDVLRILVFYWKRGYREARVDTAITRFGPGTVRVLFDITEGPPTVITALKVEYDSTLLTARRVKRLSILRAGDPLNLVVLDTMRLEFQLAMWDKGYADALVDTVISVDATARTASLLLRVDPRWKTTIGTITVRGNQQVTPGTIQRSILLRPGRVFRYVDLAQSQRNLYESNLFRLALLTVPPKPDSVKNINIDVRETMMREARVSTGFNNVDFIQADTRYTNYNTFGGARRFDITGAIGNLGAGPLNGRGFFRKASGDFFESGSFLLPTWRVSADFKQPAWLRKPENALSLGGFAHRRAAPAVYIDRGYGGQLAFTRTLAPRASASGAYRFEINRVEASDVYFCVNYGVCDNATVSSLRLHQRLSPLQLSAAIDRSDIPFAPTKGYIARVDLEHASSITVSDYRFNRAFLEASAYTHLRYPSRDPRSQVLAANVRVGFVQPLANGGTGLDLLHPRSRFYAGGSHSVRGYDENQLGPRILTIPPAELARALCDTTSAATVQSCNTNSDSLQNKLFTPRPVGGTALLEGSVELRVPFARKMEWAAFLDAGIVRGSTLQGSSDSAQFIRGSSAVTPGVGFRYRSPVGPIRIDVAYNPKVSEDLHVVTTARDAQGLTRLVQLDIPRRYESGGTSRGVWSVFNRVVLHLSIGQAY